MRTIPFLCLLALAFSFSFELSGQTSGAVQLKVEVAEPVDGKPLPGASVRNTLTGQAQLTGLSGPVIVRASRGQVLSFAANGFYNDTLTVTDSVLSLSIVRISLRPLPSTLPEATVRANLNPYQLDSLERRRNFLATVGEQTYGAIGRANDLGFGVAVNLDYFKGRERKKRRARNLFEVTEEEAYINYRWNEAVVKKYTNFKGETLWLFMQEARPSWDWLRRHTSEEDLLYHINSSLKKMRLSKSSTL